MSTQSEPCSDTSVISDTQVKANAKVPTSAEAGDVLDLIKELLTRGVEKLKENAKDRAELVAALGVAGAYAKSIGHKRATLETWLGPAIFAVWDEVCYQFAKLPKDEDELDLDVSFLDDMVFEEHRRTLTYQVTLQRKAMVSATKAKPNVEMVDPDDPRRNMGPPRRGAIKSIAGPSTGAWSADASSVTSSKRKAPHSSGGEDGMGVHQPTPHINLLKNPATKCPRHAPSLTRTPLEPFVTVPPLVPSTAFTTRPPSLPSLRVSLAQEEVPRSAEGSFCISSEDLPLAAELGKAKTGKAKTRKVKTGKATATAGKKAESQVEAGRGDMDVNATDPQIQPPQHGQSTTWHGSITTAPEQSQSPSPPRPKPRATSRARSRARSKSRVAVDDDDDDNAPTEKDDTKKGKRSHAKGKKTAEEKKASPPPKIEDFSTLVEGDDCCSRCRNTAEPCRLPHHQFLYPNSACYMCKKVHQSCSFFPDRTEDDSPGQAMLRALAMVPKKDRGGEAEEVGDDGEGVPADASAAPRARPSLRRTRSMSRAATTREEGHTVPVEQDVASQSDVCLFVPLPPDSTCIYTLDLKSKFPQIAHIVVIPGRGNESMVRVLPPTGTELTHKEPYAAVASATKRVVELEYEFHWLVSRIESVIHRGVYVAMQEHGEVSDEQRRVYDVLVPEVDDLKKRLDHLETTVNDRFQALAVQKQSTNQEWTEETETREATLFSGVKELWANVTELQKQSTSLKTFFAAVGNITARITALEKAKNEQKSKTSDIFDLSELSTQLSSISTGQVATYDTTCKIMDGSTAIKTQLDSITKATGETVTRNEFLSIMDDLHTRMAELENGVIEKVKTLTADVAELTKVCASIVPALTGLRDLAKDVQDVKEVFSRIPWFPVSPPVGNALFNDFIFDAGTMNKAPDTSGTPIGSVSGSNSSNAGDTTMGIDDYHNPGPLNPIATPFDSHMVYRQHYPPQPYTPESPYNPFQNTSTPHSIASSSSCQSMPAPRSMFQHPTSSARSAPGQSGSDSGPSGSGSLFTR